MNNQKKDHSLLNIFFLPFLGVVVYLGGLIPFFLLLSYAERLGSTLYIILWILYFGVFFSLAAALTFPAQRRRLRMMMGDEAFFAAYPRERKKEERRWRRVNEYLANAGKTTELP